MDEWYYDAEEMPTDPVESTALSMYAKHVHEAITESAEEEEVVPRRGIIEVKSSVLLQ